MDRGKINEWRHMDVNGFMNTTNEWNGWMKNYGSINGNLKF
jgi:hypothetical protein